MIPIGAYTIAPMLMMVLGQHWAAAPLPELMMGQIERETCITLKHSKCFSPYAELKTSRENGIGLGQVTKAWDAAGNVRFDKQAELRAKYPALRGWTWELRYDAMYQLTGLVLMDKDGMKRYTPLANSPEDAWAFTLSGYNGGDGHVLKDRLLCKNTKNCDETKWFGNVELYSVKSKVKWQGYGQSAYDINRGYITQVFERAPVYRAAFWD